MPLTIKWRYICITVAFALFVVGVAACPSIKIIEKDDYTGEYPELYSIAIHVLLDSIGYGFYGNRLEAKIVVLEEDKYGRKLFYYNEGSHGSTHSLIICQKSSESEAYFYSDYSFISSEQDSFSDEDTEELKRRNDWGMNIDIKRCDNIEIVRKKSKGPLHDDALKRLYEKALGDEARYTPNSIRFLVSDDYNRSIYYGYEVSSIDRRNFVLLVNADGTFEVMELSDLYNYQDDLKAFKERNGWNTPYSAAAKGTQ